MKTTGLSFSSRSVHFFVSQREWSPKKPKGMSTSVVPIRGVEPLYEHNDPVDATIAVINREAPQPLFQILERLLEQQPVDLVERRRPGDDPDQVELYRGDRMIARSPLESLANAVLLVNSDRYRTGTDQPGPEGFPDVLARLDEIPFTVRGFPDSHNEKLLFVTISRLIETRALQRGAGQVRASFQHISRLTAEPGTKTVYRRLEATDVDLETFGYGRPEGELPGEATVTLGEQWCHRNTWVVSYRPPSDDGAALFAVQSGPNVWDGYWTFDPDRIDLIDDWIDKYLANPEPPTALR